MASFPSIQSFYQKEVPSSSPAQVATGEVPRQSINTVRGEDGDTDRPLTVQWSPRQDYNDMQILDLSNGPGAIKFQGRIVNYCTARDVAARRPYLPQGHHFLVIKDDTGVIAVGFCTLALLYAPRSPPGANVMGIGKNPRSRLP